MIAKLKGLIDETGDDWAVVDVGGVGYLVFCSGRTLSRLPRPGEAAMLFVETHVREDHIHLYGFAEAGEREWFRTLLTVQGVGSKVALSILSVVSPEQLGQAIVAGDKAVLTRASGVGPKLAARLVVELKDKAGRIAFAPAVAGAFPAAASAGEAETGVLADAVSALVNLGYRRVDAYTAVAQAARQLGEGADVSALIRAGLKELGPKEIAR